MYVVFESDVCSGVFQTKSSNALRCEDWRECF
jgi:hypothetical protein